MIDMIARNEQTKDKGPWNKEKARNPFGCTDIETRFVEFYCGKAQRVPMAAARLAGYKNPEVNAYRVIDRDRVQAAIRAKTAKILEETGVTPLQIQQNALNLMDWATRKDDRTAYAKGNEQLGRTIGCFSDKVIHEDAKAEEIKANEREELEAIAQARTIPIRGA